jgi:hypothetical protein
MERLPVVSPAGIDFVERKTIAPRIADLSGKTVGEIWNGVFRGDETFPVVRELLKQRYPGINVIPYTEFPFFPGDDRPTAQQEMARSIAKMAQDKGCDAIITGNGA